MPTTPYERAQDLAAELRINTTERAELDALVAELLAELAPAPPPPPSVSIGVDQIVEVGVVVSFLAIVTDGQRPLAVEWVFGDGAVGTGLSTGHAYAAPGEYVVSAIVTDALGRVASDILTVTVASPPPPPSVFDPTKAPTGLRVVKNPDGTVTSTTDVFPGAVHYIFYHVPLTNLSDFSRTSGKITSPTWTHKPIPDGRYRFATGAWGKHPTTGAIVASKGNSNYTFDYPELIPPPPPPGPGPQPPPPVPLPAPRPPMSAATDSYVLLPEDTIDRIRKECSTPTPQWAAAKLAVDKELDKVLLGNFQGSQLQAGISNNALMWVVLKDDYPTEAAKYAAKAIAGIKSALYDNQKGPNASCAYLERGDGARAIFTVPHAGFRPDTFKAFLGTVGSSVVTKTVAITDPKLHFTIPYDGEGVVNYAHYLTIFGADGTEYLKGVDWRQDCSSVMWNVPGGKKPAVGEKYTVNWVSGFGQPPVPVTLVGTQFTFATPPRADQSVFVEYMYGNYQQTGGGVDGGFRNILIDANYTGRHLGKNVALGLAWTKDYTGFPTELKAAATEMIVRWADHVGSKWAYLWNSGVSNYPMGYYVSRCFTAAALAALQHPAAARVLAEVVAWRTMFILPALTDPTRSMKGGCWPEGWSYGSLACQNLLIAGLALEEVGVDISAERKWASEVIRHLIHACPVKGQVFDGGDWFVYPALMPSVPLWNVLARLADDPIARGYAARVIAEDTRVPSPDWPSLVFGDPNRMQLWWEDAEPLEHWVPGVGLLTMRSDWEDAA